MANISGNDEKPETILLRIFRVAELLTKSTLDSNNLTDELIDDEACQFLDKNMMDDDAG